MPGEFAVWTESFKAAGDLSTYQDRFVKLSAANTVTVAAAATDKILGVLKNAPDAAGKACRVQILGICEVDADGNAVDINVGDWVVSGADGIAFSNAAAKDVVAGQANTATTVTGPVKIEVLLMGPFILNV